MFQDDSFLGRGWAFPPTFKKERNGEDVVSAEAEMVTAREDIDQSLEILFSTSLGERVMQPEYGSNLKDFQFEPMNNSLIHFLRHLLEKAILYYEPRIKLEKLSISESDSFDAMQGILRIDVDYRIRTTNSRYNFVYDFYLREGVSLTEVFSF